MDDWALLDAWRAGETTAGNRLAAAYFPAVSRFFRSKLGDDVEDLIQQTFLALTEARDRIEGASFRSYLFAVATRRLYDHLRTHYKRRELDVSMTSMADLATTPTERIARDQRAAIVQQALRQIPIDAQVALELAYWEGLAGPELAIALDLKPSSARARLTRARDQLREAVAALGGDPENLFGAHQTTGE